MDLGLAGKTAYVTGGATGIGSSVVALLAAEGATVFVADRQGDVLKSSVADLDHVTAFEQDLSTLEGCQTAARAAVEALGGPPGVLVNNVGAGKLLGFEEIPDDMWVRTLELNLLAMVRTCRELVPQMAAGQGGAVVNVASDLARQPEPVIVDYGASKAAMLSVAKSLALAYAPKVRVNSVCPGPILTPFWTMPGGFSESIEQVYGKTGQAAIDAFVEDRSIPLARMGQPEEVARAIVFLASPAASFITGTQLGVDGGTVRALT